MANISKSPIVSNYRNVSSSKVKSTSNTEPVKHVYGKGEVHNNPDHRSGNERYIIDTFYSGVHNLMASYNRLSTHEDQKQSAAQYYKAHKNEVLKGASSLVSGINYLVGQARDCDQRYGTHFKFLVESILNDFAEALKAIGIHYEKDVVYLDRKHFLAELIENPQIFTFLFSPQTGLIDRLASIHYKIEHILKGVESEGQIIDYRT
ncbi:MAG: hypothetical protein SCL54_13970 [Bacillota bacterium]|nr:hypothetical protein [Bacillota bacterium]